MKKKIATLLVTVAMAGALFAGPALAQERYDHDAHWWAMHHPHETYAYRPVYGPGYAYPGYAYGPVMHRPVWHWAWIDGHWRWVR
jgi:hypothetical protein